ncbi:glycoside hydrolase family 2 [Pedobacter ginsengisoli]|uniref:Glycoside hydrolase family 2 n=1 Tax=Pedobacter ginsengisoli TaxID=363852 RepID=A0A2D1U3U1_9SPHI|nr:sugar-binding domain-containing protein [Pedobacter ginsengisoli]ATP56261.1 glycoside hydrolase family 2 [Pedobacter ginsengisoli]
MKHKTKIVLLTAWLGGVLSHFAYAQQDWKIQPVQMQSRWAKNVKPANAHQEYPRPQLQRKTWTNLNGLWDYVITKKEDQRPNSFTGKILVPYPIESALSGVKKALMPDEYLWYKKILAKPILKLGERVMLNFGAVDWQATVFVNGKEIGEHQGGYTAFSFDITDLLRSGNNELMVRVFDPTDQGIGPHGKQVLDPGNIYYTPSSGIWQTVWLETVPKDYIESLIITPDIDKSLVKVKVNAAGNNDVALTVGGRTVTGKANSVIKIPITSVKLWTPDDPYLYDLKVTMGKDVIQSYFGMRKVSIGKDSKGFDRIMLNNKYTYNLGTLDQGFWPDGLYTAPTDEALAFDIKAIKAMGFNTIRKHIKIEPARWYYHADKIGMMVWQDFVDPNQRLPEGAKEEFEKEAKETMDQLHNYPSITSWVVFNEGWGRYDQERLTKWAKNYDPDRLVNGHSGELLYIDGKPREEVQNPYPSSDMTDVHSYPNPMNPPLQAGKVRVLGEFGGVGVPVPGHQWDDEKGWGYVQVYPKELEGKYDGMVKQLKQLEEEGLSGSIYTQPFDVEGEENGLMTYDREIIKIPLTRLREIHSQMISLKSDGFKLNPKFRIAENIDANDTDERYPELLAAFEKGKRDSVFLRRLTLMAIRKSDQPNATKVGAAYITGLKDLYTKESLLFIKQITRTSKDTGFTLFLNSKTKVNEVLGKNAAESKIRGIIGQEEVKPYMEGTNANPDWDEITKKVEAKYGDLGLEKVYGAQMVWYLDKKDWVNFGKYYALYYQTAIARSEYHINNISWHVFLYITDPKVLDIAVKTTQYNVETFAKNDPNGIDTYANLLYKAGRKEEAIEWEEKAVKLSKDEKVFVEILEKMRADKPTWSGQ